MSDRPHPVHRLLETSKSLLLAGVLLLACVVSFGANQVVQHGVEEEARRDNTLMVDVERLMSLLKDVETGQRGFLLSGDESYLEPYTNATAKIGGQMEAVQRTGVALDGLPATVQERIRLAAAGIAARRQGGIDAAVRSLGTGRGKATMDDARAHVGRLQSGALERLATGRARTDRWLAVTTLVSGLALAGAVVLVVMYALRRRREQRAGADLLNAVLENAPVGLGLLDRSLRVQQMNHALAGMGSRALGVNVGAHIWEIMPQLRARFEEPLRQVVKSGRSVPGTLVSARSEDGDTREFQVGFYPLRAERTMMGSSEGGGAGMVVTDVTVRNRLERRVRESEERFRTLVERSASIFWTASSVGELNLGRAAWARFCGVAEETLAGMGWLGTVHEEDRDATVEAWKRATERVERYSLEHRMRRADGAWRVMEVLAVPVYDAEGSVREWVGTHVDVTERRDAENALAAARDAAEAANRAKSTFLANMSHELRTPLTAVIGYSEMLEEELQDLDEPGLVRDLGKIESNARHLLSLINDVLDLSKIEANRMTTYAEDADVAGLLRDAAGTVQSLVSRNNNRFELDLQSEPPLGMLHTDVVKLRQCVFNLISNAAKFTENGCITLKAERWVQDGIDWLRFRVSDTGIGMTPEQLSRLFERFTQADESTTRQFGGTGLGLALTRAFCRLLGGDVRVDSVAGEGSTFTVEIPARLPDQAAPAPEEAIAGSGEGATVLVVDDDAAQRDLLTRFLQRQGFTVRSAADGRTGLEMARALLPRAILLDVMMPQLDGWSVLAALKAEPKLAAIPVIMASFVNEPAMAASLGASDYLLKPMDWERLKEVMARLIHPEGAVLVVDDNDDLRTQARTVLERSGWTVVEARHGQEALEVVARAMPQMVLLDLTMPVMDGFQFLHELRKLPGGGDVPVLVLSARDLSEGDREKLRDADRVLRKGEIDLRQLPAELSDVAQSHGQPAPVR